MQFGRKRPVRLSINGSLGKSLFAAGRTRHRFECLVGSSGEIVLILWPVYEALRGERFFLWVSAYCRTQSKGGKAKRWLRLADAARSDAFAARHGAAAR